MIAVCPWFKALSTRFFIRFLKNENRKTEFSKSSTLETVFEKFRFRWPFHRLRVDGRPIRKKKLRFQKNPDTCGRGLRYVDGKLMTILTEFPVTLHFGRKYVFNVHHSGAITFLPSGPLHK